MFNKTIDYDFIALPKVHKILTGNELKLFITLFDEWQMLKNEDGWFFRSHKQLKADTGMCVTTIKKCVSSLVEKGLIFNTIHNDGSKNNTFNKANEYKINIEGIKKVSENNTFNEEGIKKQHQMVSKNDIEGIKKWLPSKDLRTKEINNIYNTTGILDLKDLGPIVSEENKKYKIKNINISSTTVPVVSEYKERNNNINIITKKEDQSSLDVKVSEPENKILSLNEMKENETRDNGTSAMNNNKTITSISGAKDTQVLETTGVKHIFSNDKSSKELEQGRSNASESDLKGNGTNVECTDENVMTTSLATPKNINAGETILQGTQVTNNEGLSQPQVKNILPPPATDDTDPRITKIVHNIDFAMNAMYKGRYDYAQFASQYEYFTLQCHNLNVLLGDSKYKLYKKQYIAPWWNNAKQYFPDGYEKLLKRPAQWELGKFKNYLFNMEEAKCQEDVERAYHNIIVLIQQIGNKYGEKVMDKLTDKIINDITKAKHKNKHTFSYLETLKAS